MASKQSEEMEIVDDRASTPKLIEPVSSEQEEIGDTPVEAPRTEKENGGPQGTHESSRGWGVFEKVHTYVFSRDKSPLQEEIDKLKERVTRRDSQIARLTTEQKHMYRQLAAMEQALKERDSHIRHLEYRMQGKERELEGMLSEREKELEELKKTLCMYDDCSEVDISSMMSGINTRVLSLARNTAQRWLRGSVKVPEGQESDNPLDPSDFEAVKSIIGPQLADALRSPPLGQSRCIVMLLPLAWQAAVAFTVCNVLVGFVAGLPTTPQGAAADSALTGLAQSVKHGEIQPAYGRWRHVTHRYMKTRVSRDEAIQAYVQYAFRHCHHIALLALKSACPDTQVFIEAFQEQLTEIIAEAFNLRTNIQEKTLTVNYDAYLPVPGQPFNKESMKVSKEDRVYPNDEVVCTTHLGMLSSRKKDRENSTDLMQEVFLHAGVLTKCNLDDILS